MSPRRRQSKPKLNLIDTGVSLAIANSLTENLMGANLMDFFTGRRDGVYKAGADGSGRITLPELFSGVNISQSWKDTGRGTVAGVIAHNFKQNWMPLAATTIGLPILVKASKKFLKPVTQPVNKLLKVTGLDVKV